MRLSALYVVILALGSAAFGEGTQSWLQTYYEDFSRGTAKGIAVRSDGALELAPAFKPIYTSPSTFIWSIASDRDAVYIGTGSPARVYRVTPEGKATIIFEPKELQVQALALRDGAIYAATSPDGRVYKIQRGKQDKKSEDKQPDKNAADKAAAPASVQIDTSYTGDVFFDPRTKYIWAIGFDRKDDLYVATGDKGEIYRVGKNGEGSVFFKSDEAHIRSLAFDANGVVIAGSEGSGLVYRVSQTGEGFVLYSAPKREITALIADKAGNIYAAGIGEKRSSPVATPSSTFTAQSQIQTTPASGVQPTPTPTPPPFNPMASSGGAEIYVISPDGSPRRLWNGKEDIVYALAFDAAGRLIAGTGNKGRVVAIEKDGEYADLVKASASQVTGFAPAANGALYAATSNLGKVFLLSAKAEEEGTFESEVFDAKIFSRWGRAEVRGRGNFELQARSGNVDNPDRNWSPWKKIDTSKAIPVEAPASRFVQWRALMRPANPHPPKLDSVRLFYRSKNVAPSIDDITILTAARVGSGPAQRTGSESVTRTLPSSAGTSASSSPSSPSSVRERSNLTARWTVRDENDDDLSYTIYYRGEGEGRWKLLKEKLSEKTFTFDSGMLPDGGYSVLVVASDAPSNTPDEALTDSRESDRFEVDTTAPRIDALVGRIEDGRIRVSFSATDTFSIIRRAEYSVDAGEWQFLEPVGQISDAATESYDFALPVPAMPSGKLPALGANGAEQLPVSGEHVVVVRIFDRFENVAVAKVVVKP
jgi:hypothetical protein